MTIASMTVARGTAAMASPARRARSAPIGDPRLRSVPPELAAELVHHLLGDGDPASGDDPRPRRLLSPGGARGAGRRLGALALGGSLCGLGLARAHDEIPSRHPRGAAAGRLV